MFADMDPQVLLEALKSQLPGLKTQAQLNAFMVGFDTLRLIMSSIFQGDLESEMKGREALEQVFDLARASTDLGNQFAEVPEAAQTASNSFVQPPTSIREYDIQRKLLSELEGLKTTQELTEWYTRTREERDQIVSQVLRNGLLDSIRSKKVELG